jgi:hypothetical protein
MKKPKPKEVEEHTAAIGETSPRAFSISGFCFCYPYHWVRTFPHGFRVRRSVLLENYFCDIQNLYVCIVWVN